MSNTAQSVDGEVSRAASARQRLKLVLAYGVIYVVWGSTYYAIRVGVKEIPPFLFAAMRFTPAGLALVAWAYSRGASLPSVREWRSIAFLGALLFLLDYGLLFWSEQRVSSGAAAIMLATIPAFMALFDIVILKGRGMTARLIASLLLGLGGVLVLTIPSLRHGRMSIDSLSALALIAASVSWSFGSVVSRKLCLPSSKSMTSGAQMLVGGLLLSLISAASGEARSFHPSQVSRFAVICLIYLIGAGSILGFTAYVWLLHCQSPTKVGTYAYVNPLVAVALGCATGDEQLSPRLVAGLLLVVVSVALITSASAPEPTRHCEESSTA